MLIGVDIRCLMSPVRTGIGEYTYQLLNAVFTIDKQNQYFLFYNSAKDVSLVVPKWNQENVRYVATKWPNKALNLLLWLGIVKLDKMIAGKGKGERGKMDYFFSPNLNFISLSSKTKLILTIHDLSFEFLPECFTLKQRLWHWFLRPKKQCQRADLILAPSENTANDIVSEYGVDRTKVRAVKHGCKFSIFPDKVRDPVFHRDNFQFSIKDKYILYLGTLEPRKNVSFLIEAYKNIYKLTNLQTYKLVIVGDKGWKSKPTMELIKNTPGVRYVGYVDEAKKAELYQNASLFVFPSLYEGFGLPVLEAMAAGVPVITSNRSSLPEVGGDAVHYVNPNNVSELAEAIKIVLTDDKLRQAMVQKGLEQAKKFSWEQAAVALKSCFVV